MPVLPGYENHESLQVPNFANFQAETAASSELSKFGGEVVDVGNEISLSEKANQRILTANTVRAENINVENDLMGLQERARDDLADTTNAASIGDQSGNGFYDGYAKNRDQDLQDFHTKYANSPNVDGIMLKARQRVEPALNQAAETEFKLRRQFQGNVYDKKINDLTATITTSVMSDGVYSYDDSLKDWNDTVRSTTPDGSKVQKAALDWGTQKIQSAYVNARAAKDPEHFNAAFTDAMSWNNDKRVLAPALTGIVTGARSVGADPRAILATGELTNGIVTKSSDTSPETDDMMRRFEGFSPGTKWDYKQYSNGYGTRAMYAGEVIDRAEAERRFQREKGKAHSSVENFAPNADPGTKAALTDLTYNAGTDWQKEPLGQAVLAGDTATARKLFVQYDHAGGQVVPQLTERRRAFAPLIGSVVTGSVQPSTPFDAKAAANYFVRQSDALKAVGIQPTPDRLYMSYHMGSDTANAVLRADPNAKIDDVLAKVYQNQGPEVLSKALHGNPLIASGMTVGQVQAAYKTKFDTALQTVDDKTSSVTAADRSKHVLSTFLGADADKMTLLGPADLGNVENEVLKQLNADAKKNDQLARGAAFMNGVGKPDPYSEEDNKAVDAWIKESGVDWNSKLTSGTGQDLADTNTQILDISKRAQRMPQSIANVYTVLLTGKGSTEQRLAGFQTLATYAKQDPAGYTASRFPDDIKKRVDDYRGLVDVDQMSPDRAMAAVEFKNSTEGKKLEKDGIPLEIDTKAEKKYLDTQVTGPKIAALLGAKSVGYVDVDGNDNARLASAYRDEYLYLRATGKSQETAQKTAILRVADTWGKSDTFGGALVPYPIEKTLAGRQINGSFDWVKEQAVNAVGVHLLSTGQMQLTASQNRPTAQVGARVVGKATTGQLPTLTPNPIAPNDVMLVPNGRTQDAIRAGNPPTYDLWYRDKNGAAQRVGAFTPDFKLAWENEKARFPDEAPVVRHGKFGPGFNTTPQ